MEERRAVLRTRVLKSRKIYIGSYAVPCAVRNISEMGARLQVQTTVGIPSEFALAVQGLPSRVCKVTWRNEHTIGVQFIGD